MIEKILNGVLYKLPNQQSIFQQEMYVHLINLKWETITKEPGINIHKGKPIEYDPILPERYKDKYVLIYEDVQEMLKAHNKKFPFRQHTFFNHVVSSQAANINLFLPILKSSNASKIFRAIKPDFNRIATEYLHNGFRIEFWDDPDDCLNDKTKMSGTDADIAIAYYNDQDELCLWLIEHKLTEQEFTECGAAKSKGRKSHHDCSKSFKEILENKNLCYYHDVRKFKYWDITEANKSFFVNNIDFNGCPFRGGLNQLWRNQILGLGIEKAGEYKHTFFSVVKHLDNKALDQSINEYKKLINSNEKFSVFNSSEFVNAASKYSDPELNKWIEWYQKTYIKYKE